MWKFLSLTVLLWCIVGVRLCEPGWHDDLHGNCYKIHEQEQETFFDEARAACKRLGAELLVIDSDYESKYVEQLLLFVRGNSVLLGAKKDIHPFVAFDGQELTYTHWDWREPNGKLWGENCIETRHGSWNDISCGTHFPFVCRNETCAEVDESLWYPADPFKQTTFAGKCYLYSGWPKTSRDANTFCEKYGAKLLTIESKAEYDFVTNWTGGEHLVLNGFRPIDESFRWLDGRELNTTATPWATDYEPNGHEAGEFCVEMYTKNEWRGKLNDVRCLHRVPFICEKRSEHDKKKELDERVEAKNQIDESSHDSESRSPDKSPQDVQT